MGRKLKRNKPLVIRGWTDASRTRGPEGVVHTLEPMFNYLDTQVCSVCRHQSCAAKVGYRNCESKVKGLCNKVTPDCMHDEDKLCERLGAPKRPDWKPGHSVVESVLAHQARKNAIEGYLHDRFLKCRPVTLIVKEGHKDE